MPDRTRDEWLVLRCQLGEPGAFEDLVREMERPLLYYAAKVLGDGNAALDVLQEVWLTVFRKIRKLKEPGSLRPWLYRIVHHMATDRIRRTVTRDRAEHASVADISEINEVPSFGPEDAAAIHQVLNALTNACGNMARDLCLFLVSFRDSFPDSVSDQPQPRPAAERNQADPAAASRTDELPAAGGRTTLNGIIS